MTKPRITLVVARAQNGVIGRGGKLPWHLPADLKRFKALTMGSAMLMGRKTFDSLPGLLPGRRHLVLTHDRDWSAPGADITHSVEEALAAAGSEPVSVIGGAEIFAIMLPRAERVELTEVLADIEGDTFMPDPRNGGSWHEAAEEAVAAEDGRPPYRFVTLEAPLAVQDRVNLGGDGVDRGHAVDFADEAATSIIRQDRRRLGAIFGHPLAHRFLIIVGAALELH